MQVFVTLESRLNPQNIKETATTVNYYLNKSKTITYEEYVFNNYYYLEI